MKVAIELEFDEDCDKIVDISDFVTNFCNFIEEARDNMEMNIDILRMEDEHGNSY